MLMLLENQKDLNKQIEAHKARQAEIAQGISSIQDPPLEGLDGTGLMLTVA